MANNYFLRILLVVFILFPAILLSAPTKTFTGPGNFSDQSRWSGNTLPAAGDDISIDGVCIFDDTRGFTYGMLSLGNPSPPGTMRWPAGSTNVLSVQKIRMNHNLSRIDMTNGGVLIVKTDWKVNGTATFVSGTGTLIIEIPGFTFPTTISNFNNLEIRTTTTVSLGNTSSVRGNLLISSGTFDTGTFPLNIAGNMTNNAIFSGSGTVNFNGTTGQTIGGTSSTTFTNLTINSTGVTLTNNISARGILTFTSGRINTGSNSVTITSTGSVTGAAAGRYVNGNLTKYVITGANITSLYEIGNSTTYNPVSITFASVSTAGNLTARQGTGDHPQIGTSCINPLKSVNYYWNLSTTAVVFTNYTATFTFTSLDYDALSNPAGFGLQNYNAGWTIPVVTGRSATTITGTTITTLGDFAVGESINPASVTFLANPGSNVCPGIPVSFNSTPANEGATPVYQWLKNGLPVGVNSPVYADSNLNANDSIRCLLTSNATCVFVPTVSSNSILITPVIGVWSGNTNSAWNVATNWCGSIVPASTDNIVINSGVANMPVLSGNTSCNNLVLSGGATLALNGNIFSINGNLSGTGNFTGSAASSLVLNGNGGAPTLYFTQTTRSDRTLQNLTINRSSSTVTLSDSLLLKGTLTLSAGTLATGDKLALLSDASGTARIGTITGGDITGKVTMERFLPGGTGWHLLSSPVTGCNLSHWEDDFIMGGFPGCQYPTVINSSILTYNESTAGIYDSGYVAPTGITNSLTANKGFWAYIINTPLTIDVTGSIIKGNQTVPLSYTNNDLISEVGWNLIANPYPSTIDWDDPNITKTNIDGAVYLFNGSSEQYSTYVGGIGINGGSQYIPSSQGILVQATGPGASITFREAAKSTQDPSFMRIQNTISNVLKLKILGASGQDETIIRFSSDATSSYDSNLDAAKLFNWDASSPAIGTTMNRDYSINSLPSLTQNISIPLRVVVMSSGTYIIRRDQLSNLPGTSCVILEDKLTGIKKDFTNDSTYSFWISDTTWSPRFVLHISPPIEFTTINEVCENGRIIAEFPTSDIYSVRWKDENATILRQKLNAAGSDTLLDITSDNYIFEISGTTQQCAVLTDVITVGKDSLLVNFTAADPSCFESTDGEIEFNFNYDVDVNVSITNGNTTVFSGVMNGSSSVNSLSAGTYSITYSNNCVNGIESVTLSPQYTVSADFLALLDTVNLNGTINFFNISSGAALYQWNFGDGTFDYNSDPSHTYNSPGVYQITLIVSNGFCTDTMTKAIEITPTQINQFTAKSIQFLLIDNTSLLVTSKYYMDDVTASFYDIDGRMIVNDQELNGTEFQIPLPDLSSGVYTVRLSNKQSVVNGRVVISH